MTITRRDFIKVVGGSAFALGFRFARSVGSSLSDLAPNAFLRISPTGIVTLFVSRPEVGTDMRTSLPMLIAEELEVDWGNVRVEQAPIDESRFGRQTVTASEAIMRSFLPLREAGATARVMLIEAAALVWRVSTSECYASEGAVYHRPSSRSIPYGKLVHAARALPIPTSVPLKARSEFKWIGKPRTKWDAEDIATGRGEYGIDYCVKDMVYVVIKRSPFFGGKIKRFDDAKARLTRGVLNVFEVKEYVWREAAVDYCDAVVQMPSGVAVVAKDTWSAISGAAALEVEWDPGAATQESSRQLEGACNAALGAAGVPVFSKGDTAPNGAAMEVIYRLPFVAHATMEPMNCFAHVTPNTCVIRAPSQEPQAIANWAAEYLQRPVSAIDIRVPTLIGGGFGRRGQMDYAIEAVIVSSKINKPVKLIYTREDDMTRGFYRPMTAQKLGVTIDAEGMPIGLRHHVVSTPALGNQPAGAGAVSEELSGWEVFGGASGDLWYDVPFIRDTYTPIAAATSRATWRGVAHTTISYAIECLIDELAVRAQRDPLTYRMDLLKRWPKPEVLFEGDKYPIDIHRLIRVLTLAAEKFGWDRALAPTHGKGIACMPYVYGQCTYIAQVAEVSVDDARRRIVVHRVVSAVDCGTVVNPSGAAAQIEGGIVSGMSASLAGAITVSGGRTDQQNFNTYPIPRFHECPDIETHFVESDRPPGPLGEVSTPVTTAAIANAVYAATGTRVRTQPITFDDLRRGPAAG